MAKQIIIKNIIFILQAAIIASLLLYFFAKISESFTKAPEDAKIFSEHRLLFSETGSLYERPTNEKTLDFIYRPASSAYKFPPAFQLLIVPLYLANTDNHPKNLDISAIHDITFTSTRLLALAAYAIACYFCFLAAKPLFPTSDRKKHLAVAAIFICFVLSNDSIFKQIHYMNAEIFIFLLLATSSLLIRRYPAVSATLCGIAASVKIYPAFMAAYFAANREKKQLSIMLVSAAISSLLAVIAFGIDESLFYFSKVLPVLIREPAVTHDFNISLESLFIRIGILDNSHVLVIAAKLLIIGWSSYLLYKKNNLIQDNLLSFNIIMLCMLIMMKNLWSAYFMLLFMPLIIAIHDAVFRRNAIKTITLFFLFFVLGINLEWWLEIQLIHELGNLAPSELESHWASQGTIERLLKQSLLTPPLTEPLILRGNYLKAAAIFVLWVWMACILHHRNSGTDSFEAHYELP